MVPSRQPDSSAGGQLALNPAARATDGGGDGERWRLGDSQRAALTREVRRECVVIEHAEYGAAVIRDQKPINEASLASALVDMTVAAWLVNLVE